MEAQRPKSSSTNHRVIRSCEGINASNYYVAVKPPWLSVRWKALSLKFTKKKVAPFSSSSSARGKTKICMSIGKLLGSLHLPLYAEILLTECCQHLTKSHIAPQPIVGSKHLFTRTTELKVKRGAGKILKKSDLHAAHPMISPFVYKK